MLIAVAMSGGVDSSVTAALLHQAGHQLLGVTLKVFCYGERDGGPRACCGLEGVAAARAVAERLGFPHRVLDVSDRFATEVIGDFVSEYAAGRTPNPCVRCNATVKLPQLFERVRAFGATAIATGHYARLAAFADGPGLARGTDDRKDQAYFLAGVPRTLLAHLHLPLGAMTKDRIRQLAGEFGLANAQRPESQEICFVDDRRLRSFLAERLHPDHPARQPGDIVTIDGRRVGRHRGVLGYTIGQRRGLGVAAGGRLYVVAIDVGRREIVLGPGDALIARQLVADRCNWLAPPPVPGDRLLAQIRHRARPVPVEVATCTDDRIEIRAISPISAAAPGQTLALFDESRLIGGGRILSTDRDSRGNGGGAIGARPADREGGPPTAAASAPEPRAGDPSRDEPTPR